MSYPNIQEFLEDFDKENELLGKGTYGAVYKMKTKRIINPELERELDQVPFMSQYLAVKMMDAKTEKSFNTIQKEFLILKSLPKQHPNIIKLYKSYAWANQITKTYTLVLVMELADKNLMTEIKERITQQRHFPDDQLHHIFLQCIQTLNDIKLHSNIYHRDIKPENILIKSSGLQILLSDFGVSKKLMKEKLPTIAGTLVGTPSYLSPILWKAFESVKFQIANINKIVHNVEKSDVYSLGITLLQTTLLLNSEIQKLNAGEQGQIRTNNLLKGIQNQRIQNILTRMLEHDEKQRASFQELLQLLSEPIPKQIVSNKKPIFSYVEPKIGIKEQFSLQAKINYQNNKNESDQTFINQKLDQKDEKIEQFNNSDTAQDSKIIQDLIQNDDKEK
ncbi:unnamed protein product [Paramecium primaurelia]|uniref:non-specific serine/threonine protein kinase n=1 Tax=Paramecium primaurelia TaxID=5886 RepID=A0A8S1LBW5_PARPR|nr:unnamed protein product [Paramecium primaurelia]